MRARYLIATVVLAAGGLVVPLVVSGVTGSASATVRGVTQAPATAETQRHCVVSPGGTQQRCFGTYRDAIAFASHGTITDAPVDAGTAVADQRFRDEMAAFTARAQAATTGGRSVGATTAVDESAAAVGEPAAATLDDPGPSWVIGATIFAGTSYTGNSMTLYVPKPCAKDGWYDRYYDQLSFLEGDVESVQSWAGCWVWLHDSKDWNGNRMGPYKEQTPDLGDWKNRAVMVGLS